MPSTTYTGESIAEVHAALEPGGRGFAYARNANPTVAALEESLAPLEGADEVVAFGSGMAAIHAAILALQLAPGDVILASSALYGVTRSLLSQLQEFEIETRYVDVGDLSRVRASLAEPGVRALYFESIANPLLEVADVASLAAAARERRVATIIDNTFATPYLLRPLELGIDIVVHSATKYLAGHGDVIAGVTASSRSWAARIRARRTVMGAVLSPFEAWLIMRGLRTLPLRMDRQSSTAYAIASYLDSQPWVERVYFPGLPASPYHDLAARMFGDRFGGMVSFDLRADRRRTLDFLDRLKIITAGTSLGDATSLVLYPPLSSHRTLTPEELQAAGIGPGLVRLSVGLESAGDLIDDLQQAAEAAGIATRTA